jgi:hypothetical protein
LTGSISCENTFALITLLKAHHHLGVDQGDLPLFEDLPSLSSDKPAGINEHAVDR